MQDEEGKGRVRMREEKEGEEGGRMMRKRESRDAG